MIFSLFLCIDIQRDLHPSTAVCSEPSKGTLGQNHVMQTPVNCLLIVEESLRSMLWIAFSTFEFDLVFDLDSLTPLSHSASNEKEMQNYFIIIHKDHYIQ